MNIAGRNLLGQAILGIPGHITKAYDSYKEGQNTRYAQSLQAAENARQEQQLRMQMAQAQVAAEKARLEMKYLPEEYKNKAEELRLRGEEFGQRKKEWEEKPARDKADFLQKGVGKIADAMDTPESILQTLGLPPEALNDPETLAKVTELAKQDRGTKLTQKVTESRLTTRASEQERTAEQEKRRLTENSLGKDEAKEFASIDKNIDKALQFDNFMDKEKLVKMSESQLMLQKSKLQNMDPNSMSYKILGSAINAREAKLNVIKGSAQQPAIQQPAQAQPAQQQPITTEQVQTWSPEKKQAILNASTPEQMRQALLVP